MRRRLAGRLAAEPVSSLHRRLLTQRRGFIDVVDFVFHGLGWNNPSQWDCPVYFDVPRERLAHVLRDRSVEAEATPRRVRGVTRKAERTPLRKLRERFEAGQGPAPRVLQDAVKEVTATEPGAAPWLTALRARRERIVRALSAEAVRLRLSAKPDDRRTAEKVVDFLKALPPVETRREAIRRRLRTSERERPPPDDGRSR